MLVTREPRSSSEGMVILRTLSFLPGTSSFVDSETTRKTKYQEPRIVPSVAPAVLYFRLKRDANNLVQKTARVKLRTTISRSIVGALLK
jgi:hypothetical protein